LNLIKFQICSDLKNWKGKKGKKRKKKEKRNMNLQPDPTVTQVTDL
jgi:hypothetical protein